MDLDTPAGPAGKMPHAFVENTWNGLIARRLLHARRHRLNLLVELTTGERTACHLRECVSTKKRERRAAKKRRRNVPAATYKRPIRFQW